MEAMSVEDKGEDIKFNVFVYNVQDGVKIDYESGDSEADSSVQVTTENSKASQKYHTNQNSSNNSKNYSSNKNTTAAKTNTKTNTKTDIAVLHVRFCFCIISIWYYEPGGLHKAE